MRLTSADIYALYQPSECNLRIYLKHHAEAEREPTEYEKVLRELGGRHEREHLSSLGAFEDISSGTLEERNVKTREAVVLNSPAIYQGVLTCHTKIAGEDCQVVGIPDFLLFREKGYVIRDAKISRHADEDNHYETVLQLNLYGWLFEETFNKPPLALEAFLGDGTLQSVPHDRRLDSIRELEKLVAILKQSDGFYEPVGWSKCTPCGYFDRCWGGAEKNDDVARVYDIDQSLAYELHRNGVNTVEDLIRGFDAATLGELRRPWGDRHQRVGKKAQSIIAHASALKAGKLQIVTKPALPDSANYVVFDIEGMPPNLDELEKVYLWGIQIFGDQGGPRSLRLLGFVRMVISRVGPTS